ncbi:MAG: hypothetical protein P9X24_13200 [Candidatus Hatepunaea meridiana]|nr:hypothetical protein [Candidatus Hatepunaea meridiana]
MANLTKYFLPIILCIVPLKAERISGYIDHVNSDESLSGLRVQVEGLGETTTDENGYYEIGSDAVIIDPDYRLPLLQSTKFVLFDARGRMVAELSNFNIESRISPVCLSSGKYFIKDMSNQYSSAFGLVIIEKTNIMPEILQIQDMEKQKQKFNS